MGYFIVLATAAGLCGLVPRLALPNPAGGRPVPWPGLTFFLALVAIPVLLYLLNPLLGIGLRASARTVAAVAAGGAALGIVRLRWAGLGWSPAVLVHPLAVFGLALAAVILIRRGLTYVPIDGPELSAWIYDARLRFAADTWSTPEMEINLAGYTIGWPLFMDFPNLLLGRWTGGEAALPFLMHLGLLATTYDLVPRLADPQGRLTAVQRVLFGWAVVLLLLAAQAYWVLFAVKLVIEPVQIYSTAMVFCAALAGGLRGVRRMGLAATIGALFAAGYLFKPAGLTLGLSLGVFWLAFLSFDRAEMTGPRPPSFWVRRGVFMAAAFLAPALFLFLSWKIVAAPAGCFASVVDFAHTAEDALTKGGQAGAIMAMALDRAAGYIGSYKVPLTAFSAAVLLLTLGVARLRWVAVAFFVYAGLYMAAQYVSYLGCVGVNLGMERYLRVVLRPMHGLGLVLAAVLSARWAIDRLAGRAASLRLPVPAMAAAAAILVALGAWQVHRLATDVAEVAERTDPTSVERMARLRATEADAASLIRLIEARGLREPNVALVKQDDAELEWDVARLLSVNVTGSGPLYHYQLGANWIWRPLPDPARVTATRIVAPDGVSSALLANEVIWPLGLDDWLRKTLTPLVGSPLCLERPEEFFLFKNPAGTGFDCVAKTGTR